MESAAGAHGERFALGLQRAGLEENERQRTSVYRHAQEGLWIRPRAPNDHQGLLGFAQEISKGGWDLDNLKVVVAGSHQSLQDTIAEGFVSGSKNCAHGTTVGATQRFRKAPPGGRLLRAAVALGRICANAGGDRRRRVIPGNQCRGRSPI